MTAKPTAITVLTSQQLADKYTTDKLRAAAVWLQCLAILNEDLEPEHPSAVALRRAQSRAAEALAIHQSRGE